MPYHISRPHFFLSSEHLHGSWGEGIWPALHSLPLRFAENEFYRIGIGRVYGGGRAASMMLGNFYHPHKE